MAFKKTPKKPAGKNGQEDMPMKGKKPMKKGGKKGC